jgi:hypothetical protein
MIFIAFFCSPSLRFSDLLKPLIKVNDVSNYNPWAKQASIFGNLNQSFLIVKGPLLFKDGSSLDG